MHERITYTVPTHAMCKKIISAGIVCCMQMLGYFYNEVNALIPIFTITLYILYN